MEPRAEHLQVLHPEGRFEREDGKVVCGDEGGLGGERMVGGVDEGDGVLLYGRFRLVFS